MNPIESLVEKKYVRRSSAAVCFAVPFGLILWNPPWFLQGYLLVAPLFFLGFGLVLLEVHAAMPRPDVSDAGAGQCHPVLIEAYGAGFRASFPDFPECFAEGATRVEALNRVVWLRKRMVRTHSPDGQDEPIRS